MIKPTKAFLYTKLEEMNKDRDWLLEQRRDLIVENRTLKDVNASHSEAIDELKAANFREREAGVAAFNRYGDQLAAYRRRLNRANWYVATMFLATVSMAAMAAVAIFV